MSKRILNAKARDTVIQINSTLRFLNENRLVIFYNDVRPIDATAQHCQITWNNQIPGRANAGKAFTKLEQYEHILANNSYHCMLFDGSLIRANFEFEDNILLIENLLWWPAPYDYGKLLSDGYAPLDLLYDFYGDDKWHEAIIMRSPVRIDFDYKKNTNTHPHSHMHIQDHDTRINVQNPICFNRFMDFIFRNFYAEHKVEFSKHDFIKYNIPEMDDLYYIPSTFVI